MVIPKYYDQETGTWLPAAAAIIENTYIPRKKNLWLSDLELIEDDIYALDLIKAGPAELYHLTIPEQQEVGEIVLVVPEPSQGWTFKVLLETHYGDYTLRDIKTSRSASIDEGELYATSWRASVNPLPLSGFMEFPIITVFPSTLGYFLSQTSVLELGEGGGGAVHVGTTPPESSTMIWIDTSGD